MKKSILQEKSFKFALRIVNLSRYLSEQKHEFVLSRKLLDSGTSIGLHVEEARQGDDRNDFRLKNSLANKDAFKTNFLLRLLHESELINEKQAASMLSDCEELQRMLIATLKTVKHEIGR
jgi:four helix bundle protein